MSRKTRLNSLDSNSCYNYLASAFEATFLYKNSFTQFHTPSSLRKAGPSLPIYLFAPQLLSFVPVRIGYNH